MKTIIIIPTYNEKENILELIQTIFSQPFNQKPDILVVDSASPDGTAEAVSKFSKESNNIYLVKQSCKMGLGKAYLEGMSWALNRDYDVLVTMDADFSHHPRYLSQLITEMAFNDLAIGSRYVAGGTLENWPVQRRMLSKFANWYARTLTGLPFSDLTSGFHCFKTQILKRILTRPIKTEGYAFLVELKFWAIQENARFKEIPIVFCDRTKGASKISKKVIFESIRFILKLSRYRSNIRQKLKTQEHQ